MDTEFQVREAGLRGQNWTSVRRGPETKARAVFHRQLQLYTIGRFRLLDPAGRVVEERTARPLFSDN